MLFWFFVAECWCHFSYSFSFSPSSVYSKISSTLQLHTHASFNARVTDGCVIWLVEFVSYGKNGGYEAVIVIADCIFFVVLLAVELLVPKGIVDIEKKLNPEKQGLCFHNLQHIVKQFLSKPLPPVRFLQSVC